MTSQTVCGMTLRSFSFSSVSLYYLATISYTSQNNEYIHKLIEVARRAIRNHKAIYEMDLLNPRI